MRDDVDLAGVAARLGATLALRGVDVRGKLGGPRGHALVRRDLRGMDDVAVGAQLVGDLIEAPAVGHRAVEPVREHDRVARGARRERILAGLRRVGPAIFRRRSATASHGDDGDSKEQGELLHRETTM